MKQSLFNFVTVIVLTLASSFGLAESKGQRRVRDFDVIHRKAFSVCKAEAAAADMVKAYQEIPGAVKNCRVTYNQIPSAPSLERVLDKYDKFEEESRAWLTAFVGKTPAEVMDDDPGRFAYHANTCDFHFRKFWENDSLKQYSSALTGSINDSKNARNKQILTEARSCLVDFNDHKIPQLLKACGAMVAKGKCINEYLKVNAPSYNGQKKSAPGHGASKGD
ncbi:hypothetical protein WDW86_21925 [Bdellovibrionota bacterium FG-2]